ncbi:MAG: hypothetical protein DCC73_09800 [Proteobacteria bacterium]|nr:MAG: hypothetical protein DCC73_09800 [Pseudomonadota bacterium]
MARTVNVSSQQPKLKPWMVEAIRFATYLDAAANAIRKSRSGEKTSLKLLASGARLLEDCTFQDLQIEQVASDAGTAKGTFYIYFESKDIFLQDLARRYCQFEQQTLPVMNSQESTFLDTCRWVAWYERTFAANAGIIRCIVQMGETVETMRTLWHERNERVTARILNDLLTRLEPKSGDLHMVRLAVRTAGGMMDQSLFNRYRIQTGTGLQEKEDPEFLIVFHAILIYRAIVGENPPREVNPEMLDAIALIPR